MPTVRIPETPVRRIPELAGIENNPWFVLLVAGRRNMGRLTGARHIVWTFAILIAGTLTLSGHLSSSGSPLTKYPDVGFPLLLSGVAAYLLFLLTLLHCGGRLLGGVFHPISRAYRLVPDPMHDLFVVERKGVRYLFLAHEIYPNGRSVDFSYDAAGRLFTVPAATAASKS